VKYRLGVRNLCAVGVVTAVMVLSAMNTPRAGAAPQADTFGYGLVMIGPHSANPHTWGFNWMKVFDGPNYRPPASVLYLLPVSASDVGNLLAVQQRVDDVLNQYGDRIDAYEIGNEVNLDATFGWGTAPNAADYKLVLCAAYNRIKSRYPAVTIVSAGLASVGRVSGNWGGHPGHNGSIQDEREYLKELIAAGVGGCLDGVGYHPFGFSADYDAPPDVNGGSTALDCSNGLCFRSAEGLHAVMQANGLGSTKMWATEMGWLVLPPVNCSTTPGPGNDWSNRTWQAVTPQKQASNLAGAFRYARANWPWMGAMFVFNLNFNAAPYYDECNQMRYYSVLGRPAEQALHGLFTWHYLPLMMR
jgi:hypothetical protein